MARISLTRWLQPFVLCAALVRVGAQDPFDAQHPVNGIIQNGRLYTIAAIRGSCPRFVLDMPDPRDEMPGVADNAIERSCRVVTDKRLADTGDGAAWMTATYERAFIIPADSARRELLHVEKDTIVVVNAIVYVAAPQATQWRAVWHGAVLQRYTYTVTPTVGALRDGSALMSVEYCMNGTGGCWQEFLRRRRARWTQLKQVYRAQLPPIPDGRVGKGVGIDVKTLRGSFGVYGSGDANCCPSGEVLLTLDVRGDSLVLKTSRVRPSPPL